MNFAETLSYINEFKAYEDLENYEYSDQNFNLSRLRDFLHIANIDLNNIKFIHVAGSKGKGTVSTILSDYLTYAAFDTGLFLSPYMVDYRDYFIINGKKISKNEFTKIFTYFANLIHANANLQGLTRFELSFLAVLKYFTDKNVDYAVIEVGMGGKKDATNVIFPLLSVLTRVEKEHTEKFGNTYSEILNEKCGIYKGGHKMIVGPQNKYVKALLKNMFLNNDEIVYVEGGGSAFFENSKTAYTVLNELLGGVDKNLFKRVINEFFLVGRMDIRKINGKTVVLDIAHTEASIKNLIQSLKNKFPNKKFVFLISIMKGKNARAIMEKIIRLKPAPEIIFVESHKIRSMLNIDLIKLCKNYQSVTAIYNIKDGMHNILNKIKENEVLVVTGSHFLIKEIIPLF